MAAESKKQRPVSGAKELAENGEMPELYVKPEHARARASEIVVSERSIPVIDISQIHGEGRDLVVKAIVKAASEWGFFQVINHGVPRSVMESIMQAGRAFFDLPLEHKMRYFSEDYKIPFRFCTSFSPSTEDRWDWHDNLTHYFPPYGEEHPWPKEPQCYKQSAMEYLAAVTNLGDKISEVLSEGLGLQPDRLAKAFKERMQSIRMNFYPPCPRPDLAIGQSPHSDFGGFTIVLQDEVGGLQVKNKGVWYSVVPIKDSFVVNISDQLQIFSNGVYQSSEHRVAVNSDKARLSIATFFEPAEDVVVAPIPELLSEANPPRYRESLFGSYLGKQFSKYFDSKNAIEALKI